MLSLRSASRRTAVLLLLLVLVATWVVCADARRSSSSSSYEDEDGDGGGEDYSLVTYGSALRFRHVSSGFHLHSHGISYGSGSGQQSVTAVSADDDSGSLWQLKEAVGAAVRVPGTPLRCGDVVRLQHVTTRRYLHSHLHTSPLTNKQEVSGYGEGSHSDTGDSWRVDCSDPQHTVGYALALTPPNAAPHALSLVHVDTGKRLYSRRIDEFTQQNCRGCPILGQLEVSAAQAAASDAHAQWSVAAGVLFPAIA